MLDAHIGKWSQNNDPSAYPDIQRARFDRLIALRDRARMQDVVNEYNRWLQEGVEVPPYALSRSRRSLSLSASAGNCARYFAEGCKRAARIP